MSGMKRITQGFLPRNREQRHFKQAEVAERSGSAGHPDPAAKRQADQQHIKQEMDGFREGGLPNRCCVWQGRGLVSQPPEQPGHAQNQYRNPERFMVTHIDTAHFTGQVFGQSGQTDIGDDSDCYDPVKPDCNLAIPASLDHRDSPLLLYALSYRLGASDTCGTLPASTCFANTSRMIWSEKRCA